MSEPNSIALLGGHNTGKSTYLGALVDALQTERIHHLRLNGLDADARGLLQLAEPLQVGEYPLHTSTGQRVELIAPLRTEGRLFEHTTFTLRAGDYDGEEVERLFKDRIQGWTPEWKQRALSAGLLLVVRADPGTPPPTPDAPPLDEAERWRMLRQARAPSSSEPAQPQGTLRADDFHGPLVVDEVPAPPRLPLSAKVSVPKTFALIELLQFIRNVRQLAPGERPRGKARFPVALVVSSWDAVKPAWREAGPGAYLAQQFPLLEDYLWSNFFPEDVTRFGLSSTGGDLKDPVHRARYLDDPCGFVEWRDFSGRHASRDIGLPLYWLLFGEKAFEIATP